MNKIDENVSHDLKVMHSQLVKEIKVTQTALKDTEKVK